MKNILLRWIIQMIAVWVATAIVPGVSYDNAQSLLIAALVLSILNILVKPVMQVISIPFIIMTFGLFLLVINALLIRMTAWLVNGFHVSGFWSAVGASLVISIVSMFFGYNRLKKRVVAPDDDEPTFTAGNGPPPGKGPIIDV